jgi:hypothetical protein
MRPPARTRFAVYAFCVIGLTIFMIASAQAQNEQGNVHGTAAVHGPGNSFGVVFEIGRS